MRKTILFILLIFNLSAYSQNSQVKVTLRNGSAIEGKVKEFDPLDHITIIVGGIETTIPMAQVAYVSNNQVQESMSETESKVEYEQVIAPDPLADYKGFLLAAGNKVYVYCSNSDSGYEVTNDEYTNAAKKVLESLLVSDGFWTVVDNMNEAHFTINYFVDTVGMDKTYLSLSSWRTHGSYQLGRTGGSEAILDNKSNATLLYKKYIVPLQKKIINGKLSNKIKEEFTVK